jgi:hypothetical protein
MPSRPSIRLIAQKGSPLGTRRHVACVERRVRGGQPGAYVCGDQRYLTPEALEEEREAPPAKPKPRAAGKLDPIQRELVGVRFLGKVQ